VIVYTCSLGEDTSPLLPAPEDARCIAFVDNDVEDALGWDLVRVPASENPRLACRRLKTAPHILFPGEATLWVDAAYRITAPVEAIALFARGAEFAAFKHSARKNCYEESRRVMQRQLCSPSAVKGMMRRYEADSFCPQHLTCGGFLYRRHTPLAVRQAEVWWSQISECSWRDQLSIDYAAWKAGLDIFHLPGSSTGNVFAIHHSHRAAWKVAGHTPHEQPLEDDWFKRVLKIV
jgi:hypothetical protein